jgi:hypothetical protein
MASNLPHQGTLYYNGFWFPQHIKANFRASPVRDTSGRYIKYTVYSLTVEFIVEPGVDDYNLAHPITGGTYNPVFDNAASNLETGMATLRRLLTTSGRNLMISGKGFGVDLNIQFTSGNVGRRDVKYGPHPTVLSIEPLGSNKAFRIVWSVEIAIVDCTDLGNELQNLAEFSTTVVASVNELGMTTLTTSGFIEAVAERIGIIFQGTIDTARTLIGVWLPFGFQRVNQTFNVSPDRSKMTWTIVDSQHPSDWALYPGIVDMDIRHRISSKGPVFTGEAWDAELSGSIRVAKGFPRWHAWVAFIQIVTVKRQAIKDHGSGKPAADDDKTTYGKSNKTMMILRNLTIEEELFGRGMSFSLTWEFWADLNSIFEASALWEDPVKNEGETVPTSQEQESLTWSDYGIQMIGIDEANPQNLPKGPWSVRGHSQTKLQATDTISTLCIGTTITAQNHINLGSDAHAPNWSLLKDEKPPPEQSYRKYKPRAILMEETSRDYHQPLGLSSTYNRPAITPGSVTQGTGYSVTGSGVTNEEPIYHKRGVNKYRVIFGGVAERVAYKIPRFHLLSYGGQNAEPIGTAVWSERLVGDMGNFRVYRVEWMQEYILDGHPTGDLVITDPDPRKFIEVT